MFKSNVAAACPKTFVALQRSGRRLRAEPWRQIAQGARAALEGIGLISLLVLVCVALAPELRGPVEKIGTDVGVTLAEDRTEQPELDDDVSDESDGLRIDQQVVLAPADDNVAVYLARRYHVAEDAVRVMVATAQAAGRQQQVDPLLILAVVAVESSMNPFAQSPVGARGLMQVMPGLHGGKFVKGNGALAALDPVANIQVGSQILSDVIRRGGSIERGLQLYVGAGNLADDGGYAGRVLGELSRIRLAATGSVAAALAAGMRSDTHVLPEGSNPLTSVVPADLPAPLARRQRTV
ncbi:MAG TPA: transglycosylase SLT domain-containing protein [Burkholderiaceae bacterium]|nr:transglycosylase SLT domain-containing protein [Burkholderiaceae bacterium]